MPLKKLSTEDVVHIGELWAQGYSKLAISRAYEVHWTTVIHHLIGTTRTAKLIKVKFLGVKGPLGRPRIRRFPRPAAMKLPMQGSIRIQNIAPSLCPQCARLYIPTPKSMDRCLWCFHSAKEGA